MCPSVAWSFVRAFVMCGRVHSYGCTLILRVCRVSPLYSQPQLHRIDYTLSLVVFSSIGVARDCVYAMSCSCSRLYKCEACRILQIRAEEHRKAVTRDVDKLGVSDPVWKNGDHLPLWD